jgi:hypothetical protein
MGYPYLFHHFTGKDVDYTFIIHLYSMYSMVEKDCKDDQGIFI